MVFPFAKYLLPHYSVLGSVPEQLSAQTLTYLINSTLPQGVGERRKNEVKVVAFPTLLTMIVFPSI